MSSLATNVPGSPTAASTVMACLLFGTNFFLYVFFQTIKYFSRPSEDIQKGGEKKLSKPFTGTLECFTNITSEIFRTGCVMLLTYVCEKYWIFEHSTKSYSRDLFMFVLILFFAYGIYTIKPHEDQALLGRAQTEEWKGWMQFIFLLYHYFHAEEVYNSVRVMITCYVWMTGFGNFSFFYMKQDFGWLRVVQMLWRLNFSVLLLMWTHGNTYILYYICPLHTFYFLMVYATMAVYSSVNHSKWAIRVKLFIVGVIIFIVWDINGGLFDILFAWMGTVRKVGANSGSVWEYYFRTSLDHWSSFLGMIFALNFPLAEQYFVKARGWPLYVAAVGFAALSVWWYLNCYMLEKLEYNLTHAYFAIIPLTSYIFFRNCTPYVRGYVSMSLHDLGKTTLETYLLQHHIWLTSNAKTLLTLTPGYPWCNFAFATLLFFTVSKELYRLTMSLRGMVIPDDGAIAKRNLVGTVVIVLVVGVFAQVLHSLETFSLLELGMACLVLALGVLACIRSMNRQLSDSAAYSYWSGRAVLVGVLLLVVGTGTQMLSVRSASSDLNFERSSNKKAVVASTVFWGNDPSCMASVGKGSWSKRPCPATISTAFCTTDKWEWDSSIDTSKCPISQLSEANFRSLFKGKSVGFVGDSGVRNVYHQFIHQIDSSYDQNRSYAFKHMDLKYSAPFDSTTSVEFFWAPYIANVSSAFESGRLSSFDLIIAGGTLWDALHVRDLEVFKKSIDQLAPVVAKVEAISVWLQPLQVVDEQLNSADKTKYMGETRVQEYRDAFSKNQAAGSAFKSILNPRAASEGRLHDTVDGVHYTGDVYDVVAQMLANTYALQSEQLYNQMKGKSSLSSASAKAPAKYVPKVTGSMSLPEHGLGILILSVIMLFLMDSFLGIGFLSLSLFGLAYDWDAAYTSLNRRILGILPVTARPAAVAAVSLEMSVEKSDKSSDDGAESEQIPFINK